MHSAQLNYFTSGLKSLKNLAISEYYDIGNLNDIFDPSKFLQLQIAGRLNTKFLSMFTNLRVLKLMD